jgi:hypothetical protein
MRSPLLGTTRELNKRLQRQQAQAQITYFVHCASVTLLLTHVTLRFCLHTALLGAEVEDLVRLAEYRRHFVRRMSNREPRRQRRECGCRSVRRYRLILIAIPHLRNASMRNAIYTLSANFVSSDDGPTFLRRYAS